MLNNLKKIINLYSTNPVSRKFGFDRGTPIDRYYIEKFLSENKKYIRGDVLEVADSYYTDKFGGRKVNKSIVFSYEPAKGVDVVGDLTTGKGVLSSMADCVILTQTLPFVFDVQSAVGNSLKLLRSGGVLLLTVPGITQISRYDMDRWGHYWTFTDLSTRRLFEKFVPKRNISVTTYGNVKSACSFLYGLSSEEMQKRDLDYKDNDYQVVIAAVIKKSV